MEKHSLQAVHIGYCIVIEWQGCGMKKLGDLALTLRLGESWKFTIAMCNFELYFIHFLVNHRTLKFHSHCRGHFSPALYQSLCPSGLTLFLKVLQPMLQTHH